MKAFPTMHLLTGNSLLLQLHPRFMVLTVCLMLGATFITYTSQNTLILADDQPSAARRSLVQLQGIVNTLQHAESEQRGYLLTGNPGYLRPFEIAVERLPSQLAELEQTPEAVLAPELIARLKPLANAKIKELSDAVAAYRARGLDAALPLLDAGNAQRTMLAIHELLTEQSGWIRQAAREWNEQARYAANRAILSETVTLVIGLGVIGFLQIRLGQQAKALIDQEATHGEDLARTAADLRHIIAQAPNAYIGADSEGRVVLVNRQAEAIFGHSAEELSGKPIETLVPAAYQAEHVVHRVDYLQSPQSKPMGQRRNLYGLRKDGSEVPIEVGLVSLETSEGKLTLAGITDISERKQSEAAITSALKEKTVLLNEIHHRVKNNLQVIDSLLNLQANRTDEDALKSVLVECQSRVKAMSLIHQLLYERQDFSKVHLDEYLERLVRLISGSWAAAQRDIAVRIDADRIDLDLTQAVPCGLLVNELLTNAFKHAFPGRGGEIRIRLKTLPEATTRLSLGDDGVGLPADLDPTRSKSLGLQLVALLAEQLGANMQVERAGGTEFNFEFSRAQPGSLT